MAQVLQPIKETYAGLDFPDLLVGLGSPDDAAVWKLDEDRAVVLTTDFFTPVVDDPYAYGAIAAANSMSDVYAMGGKPILALNVAALPADLPLEVSREIMRGAAEKCREGGVVIAGGHTVTDAEPKFGLVVMGLLDPNQMLTKEGLQPGDSLFLSKPLGIGLATTALKRGLLGEEALGIITDWMSRLNKDAAELALASGLASATDITGFGLLGHASEMASASDLGLELWYEQLPVHECALPCIDAFTYPGGAFNNRDYFGKNVTFDPALTENQQMLIFDPQTSGGLLMSVPADAKEAFLARATAKQVPVWEIGKVIADKVYKVLKNKPG